VAGINKGLEKVLCEDSFFWVCRKFIQVVLVDSLFLAANIIRGSSASTFPDLFGRGEALEPRIYEGSLGLEV
jgi:hypothetical protein